MKFKKKNLTKEQKERREKRRYFDRVEAFEEGRLSEVGEVKIIEELFKRNELQYISDNGRKFANTFIEKGLINI